MSQLFTLVNEAGPCAEAEHCHNAPLACESCRLSPGGGPGLRWWPKLDAKHPVLEAEKKQAKLAKVKAIAVKRAGRDRGRMAVQKQAQAAEKRTERNIIHATLNSGRANQDADHVSAGRITLDTKLQSKRIHPLVKLGQLDKVREDAKRAGMLLGALVLRNSTGRGVVVLDEDDYARLVR